jgi:hypothetical protein
MVTRAGTGMAQQRTLRGADYFRARLRTLHGSGGGAADLDRLHGDAVRALGADHSVSLLIECTAEYERSRHRPVEDAVGAWERLMARAARHLAPHDPTLMAIRAYRARYVRYRAVFGDLDEVVRLRTEELLLRESAAPDDVWIEIARADLAVALTDRGQFGGLDPTLAGYVADVDLREARELIETETEHRRVAYGDDHPFTWHARGILARTLLALADKNVVAEPAKCAAAALTMAEGLIEHFRRTGKEHSEARLRAQLTQAEALIVPGRHDRAARHARMAYALAQSRVDRFDLGWPLLVLARAQEPFDRTAALRSAERALAVRSGLFGKNSYKVAEARHMITGLAVA